MSSNEEGFGAFDDVIIKSKRDGKWRMDVIQVKHKKNNTIKSNKLNTKNSDYNLCKYEKSYQEIKTTIGKSTKFAGELCLENVTFHLCTNSKLNISEREKFYLEPPNNLLVSVKKSPVDVDCHFVNTTNNPFNIIHIEDAEQDNETVQHFAEFFKAFRFYDGQANNDQMDKKILKIVSDHFGSARNFKLSSFLTFTECYFKGEGMLDVLNKKTAAMKVLEILLRPYVLFPNVENDNDIMHLENWYLFDFPFDVIVFDKNAVSKRDVCAWLNMKIRCKYNISPEIPAWSDHFVKPLRQAFPHRQKMVNNITDEDILFQLWNKDIVPLIVKTSGEAHQIFEKAVNKFANYKFKYFSFSDLQTESNI